MTNYYELLGIARDAGQQEIEQAIKKTRRIWNNRSNSPDATIRAEAEKHVREVAEAEKILLDTVKREQYNRELSSNPSGDTTDRQGGQDSDWEAEYWEAYGRDMNEYAAQIARNAVNRNEKDGKAWYLYGEAVRRGGDNKQAIEILNRATIYLRDNEFVYRQLGIAYMDVENYDKAYSAFQKAAVINPKDGEYHSRLAVIHIYAGDYSGAVKEAQTGFACSPDDNYVRYIYFESLYEGAMKAISYNRSSGKHLITNKAQLSFANQALKEMALTIPNDENKSNCTREMEELTRIVVDAESIKGGGFLKAGKCGYLYNYEISNSDTRASGIH